MRALVQHHALREQAGEGLVDRTLSDDAHRAGEKAGVEKMENRVFNASDVLLNGQPASDGVRVKGQIIVVGICEPQVIPR